MLLCLLGEDVSPVMMKGKPIDVAGNRYSRSKPFIVLVIALPLSIFVLILLFWIDLVMDTSMGLVFIPEFLAGMLGVLIGFGFGLSIEYMNDTRKGAELLDDLLVELAICLGLIERLKEDQHLKLPTGIWTMGIMSGSLSSIRDNKIRRDLYAHYMAIEGLNWQTSNMIQLMGQVNDDVIRRFQAHIDERSAIVASQILSFLKSVDHEGKVLTKN